MIRHSRITGTAIHGMRRKFSNRNQYTRTLPQRKDIM
jgi:hypothetical protein